MTLFGFDHPALLWLLLLAAPITWLGVRSLASLDRARRWTAIGLRLAVLTILVLMLAGAQAVRWHNELAVVAVIDESESVRRFAHPPPQPSDPAPNLAAGREEQTIDHWLQNWIHESAKDRKPDDLLGVVTFDGRATVRSMPSPGFDTDPGIFQRPRDGTDIAAALRLAMATLPADSTKRLFLTSDGNENATSNSTSTNSTQNASGSDLLAAAYEAKAAGIPIDVLPLDYRVEHEVMVQGVYAPTEARDGQTIALRVVLRATEPTDGTLYLKHDGVPVNLGGSSKTTGGKVSANQWSIDSDVDSALGKYVCVKMVEVAMPYSGANRFDASFEPANPAADTMAANNQAQAFTLVHGKGRILFVDNLGAGPGEVLPKTLADHGILLDLVTGSEIPTTLPDMQRYDAVILQNVPAEMASPAQQKMLARYVNDLGGGLIMIGGPDSFGAGGWTNSPIDHILPVDCQIPTQMIMPAGALVIVLDNSGSMSVPYPGTTQPKQNFANDAAILAIQTLFPQDYVGVVTFGDVADWIAPLAPNEHPAALAKKIRRITAGGGNSMYNGLDAACEALTSLPEIRNWTKHVIILTDAIDDTRPETVMPKLTKAGITVSCIGVGSDQNTQLLTLIAKLGGGEYHPITDYRTLPQVFIKEARAIRKNLIKETPFKPKVVSTGSPIMAGVSTVPELQGLVLTGPKQNPRVFMPLLGSEGEPLFAHWQVGLGRTAAFTSDASNRWATSWMTWNGYADFWTRTVRAIARPADSRRFDLVSTIHNDTMHLRLDASGAGTELGSRNKTPSSGSFVNFLHVAGSVIKPDGTVETVDLHQTGPGVYESDTPASAEGNYITSLFVESQNGERHAVFGGVSRPVGAELRNLTSNRAILEQVAEITGGRVLDPLKPEPGAIFNRESVTPSRSVRPLWWPLLIWLLVLFLLDVACRRIAWDADEIRRAITNWFGFSRSDRSEDAESTMAALKVRIAQVGEQFRSAPQKPAAVVESAPTTTKKFEAAPDAELDEDFAAAVGGASASAESARLAAAARKGPATDEPQTTSRLLDAKRRAQRQIEDKPEN